MADRLTGKVAIVTGAGSGMGRAIAEAFAHEGAKVMLADFNLETVKETQTQITGAGGTAATVKADMSQEADIVNMVKQTVQEFGQLDVLVNNAGIMDNFKTVETATDDLWERVLAVNLTGPFKAAREAVKVINDQENGGVIINNASIGGLFGARGGVAYTVSKHGLVGLTKNIAATFGTFGKVRANAIAPGSVATNIGTTITDPDKMGYQAIAAAGAEGSPLGQPEDIAALAVFLASDESKFINGDIITADGGWTVR
ncbi:glucose 1-dehydrogenase [Secundilactobacillus folii]|uniref:Glucose 1-dehydrogenase n=1 Tax=Secundilactobacillus folii TaxID=2678357 RepID=A0A7X2XVF4_9LACO|nr:glucose 1-dehydrogenase [Secundilactobacillus folii]MTV82265.1 glucose 1-dehydrogenase [Secundilactobacillus folii]